MIVGATAVAQEQMERKIPLLLDDPAAELDETSLARLLEAAYGLQSQLIVTALDRDRIEFPAEPRVFHVEHGELTAETGQNLPTP